MRGSIRILLGLLVFSTLLLAAPSAHAQCINDGDCSGCRECVAFVCVCLNNADCGEGQDCIAGACVACGGNGQPHCPTGNRCGSGNSQDEVCDNWKNTKLGVCTNCGGSGQLPCDPSDAVPGGNANICKNWLVPEGTGSGAECVACGTPSTTATSEHPDEGEITTNVCFDGNGNGNPQFCRPEYNPVGDEQHPTIGITCQECGRNDDYACLQSTPCDNGASYEVSLDPVRDLVIDNFEAGFGGALPSDLQAAADNLDYCYNSAPAPFTPAAHPSWPTAEKGPAVRTIVRIHGRLGGGYDPVPSPLVAGDPRTVRAYQIDYNASGRPGLPMRVLERRTDGSWNPTPVLEGTKIIDGTNFTINEVAEFTYDALQQLPVEGDLVIIGHSQGGFITKDLIHNHYYDLRTQGKEIVKVVFLGHPHFGIIAKPEDYVPFICSSLVDLSPEPFDPRERAQDCASGRWMMGWNDASAALDNRAIYFDNRDYPQIEWITVSGNQGPGAFLPIPFLDRFTPVDISTVDGDDTVPTESSDGLDVYGSFHIGDHQFDQVIEMGMACGHDAVCLQSGVDPAFLDATAICGDVDGSGLLDAIDPLSVRGHLAGIVALSMDALDRCSVVGDGACDIADVAVLERVAAALPPYVSEVCPTGAPLPADAEFFTNESAWRAAVDALDDETPTFFDEFDTTAGNLGTANQLLGAPAVNSDVCGGNPSDCRLTFETINTDLCRRLELRVPDPLLTFSDTNEGGSAFSNSLSPGDINNYEKDDFEVLFPDPIGTFAAGFSLIGNSFTPNESLLAMGMNGETLGVLNGADIPGGTSFLGVISSRPIGALWFAEDPDANDLGFRDIVLERTLSDGDGNQIPDCEVAPGAIVTLSKNEWDFMVGSSAFFPTTAANVSIASGIASSVPLPLGTTQRILCTSNCNLGWTAAQTGTCRDFSFRSPQAVSWADSEGQGIVWPDALSVGDIDNEQNDDFAVHVDGGEDVYALGFEIVDNNSSSGESLRVYSTTGELLLTAVPPDIPPRAGNNGWGFRRCGLQRSHRAGRVRRGPGWRRHRLQALLVRVRAERSTRRERRRHTGLRRIASSGVLRRAGSRKHPPIGRDKIAALIAVRRIFPSAPVVVRISPVSVCSCIAAARFGELGARANRGIAESERGFDRSRPYLCGSIARASRASARWRVTSVRR